MNIYWINDENATLVARLMARVKPDWWDYQGAMMQLMQHSMFGWYMGEKEGKPVGWISVKMLPAYHVLYLETFGCAMDDVWSAEEKMKSLYEYAERFALKTVVAQWLPSCLR